VVVVIAVFVLSRLVAYAAGLRFDDGLLHNAYQLLDVRLLRDDPFESIFYLHSQPPLFNAFTALLVHLPDSFVNTTLMLLWHAAGLATALLLYATMVRIGVRTGLAAGFVCVFVLMPETLLVESWFFYTQLEMLLLALMLWSLARFASSRTTADGLFYTAVLGALVLLRSSFHVLLMVLLIVIVWRQLRIDRRKMAVIAAVPLVVVGAWSVKNVVVFDSWSNSTWVGMNLSYLARAGVTDARCRALVAQHAVSPIACVRAFSPPSAYAAQFPHPHRYGVAATDDPFKSTGQPNYNASLYLDVAEQYQRDAIDLLRDGGVAALARAEGAAYTVWAEPGDDVLQLRRARRPIAGYADWFDRLVLLRPVATGWNDPNRFTADAGAFPVGGALGSISYTLLALFGLALYGAITGWRRGRRGDPVLRCVCVAGLIVVGYSTVVGNALDYRENNRFRVETAPVVLVLGALGAEHAWQRIRARRAGGDREPAVDGSLVGDAPAPG
jgi:Dolichyl-phosphate-mannose-protein mannosyltransferase